jgi:hypothetical protein
MLKMRKITPVLAPKFSLSVHARRERIKKPSISFCMEKNARISSFLSKYGSFAPHIRVSEAC